MDYPEYGVAPTELIMTPCEVLCWIGYRRAIPKDLYYAPLREPYMGSDETRLVALHAAIPEPKPQMCPMDDAERQLMTAVRAGRLKVGYLDGAGAPRQVGAEIFRYAMTISARGSVEADPAASPYSYNMAENLPRTRNVHFFTEEVLREWFRDDVQTDRLSSEPSGDAPSGLMFIDDAIVQIRQRAACPMGAAVKMLLDAIRAGNPRTWMRHHLGPTLIPPANWADAHIDPEAFAERRRGGIRYDGSEYHMHRFLLAEDEFGYWLGGLAPSKAELPKSTEPGGALSLPSAGRKSAPRGNVKPAYRAWADSQQPYPTKIQANQWALRNGYSTTEVRKLHTAETPRGRGRPDKKMA